MGDPILNGSHLAHLEYSRQHFNRHVSRETSKIETPDESLGNQPCQKKMMFHVKHDQLPTTLRHLRAHREPPGRAEDTVSRFPGSSSDTLAWHPHWV